MGILDEHLKNCKKTAEAVLLSVKEHTENLDRNFEEIMNLDKDVQSFRLSSFLAGYVGKVVHNSIMSEMTGWWKGARLDTANRSIQKVMTDNGYRIWDLEKSYDSYIKSNPREGKNIFIRNFSFYQGGEIIANRVLMNDRTNTLHNLTIFLDTLEAADGHYIDGVSYKNGILENVLSNLNSQSKPKKTTVKNTKDSIKNDNIDDEEFYLIATKEVDGSDRNDALWAKCMATNMGDEKKAKYDYINKRAVILSNEVKDKAEQKTKELEDEAALRKTIAKQKIILEEEIRREEYLKLKKKHYFDKGDTRYELQNNLLFPQAFNQHQKEKLIAKLQERITDRIEKEFK